MNPRSCEIASLNQDSMTDSARHTAAHTGASLNGKSGKRLPNGSAGTLGKNDSRYWASRIFRPQNSDGKTSPHYSMRVAFKGSRMAFSLRTANKDAAARIARDIYCDLLSLGVEATLAKHRAQSETPTTVATVGEWIEAAREISEANSATFNCYAASLRKIVGDILAIKRTKKRFGPQKGGAKDYRAKIDAASLDILAPDALQKWRLEYVRRAGNPAQERSRMTSCNSTIRQARSLFARKVVKFLPSHLLPTSKPFEGVEFFPRQNAKYFSRIDPKSLLRAAHEELAKDDTPAFLAMLLALAAGLRRGEIDSLCWHQVDFERELLRIETTDRAGLKTADSRAEVPIDSGTIAILRGFWARSAEDEFVVFAKGSESGPRKWGRQYRADGVFTRLTVWLRANGVTARKPLHELRKELGSLVTAQHGIYAASRVLRHADVATTARHYTDLKTRPVVSVGGWILPTNVTPIGGKEKSKRRIA